MEAGSRRKKKSKKRRKNIIKGEKQRRITEIWRKRLADKYANKRDVP